MMRAPETICLLVVTLAVLRAGLVSGESVPRTADRRFTSHERIALLVAGAGLAAGVGLVIWRLLAR